MLIIHCRYHSAAIDQVTVNITKYRFPRRLVASLAMMLTLLVTVPAFAGTVTF